jgi:hypothetical protein
VLFRSRFAGWALRMPGLDRMVFNTMLKQADAAQKSARRTKA